MADENNTNEAEAPIAAAEVQGGDAGAEAREGRGRGRGRGGNDRGGDRGGRGGGFRAERGPREDRGGYGDRAPRNEEMA